MTREIYVQARADHVASLASATPLSAIEELVWNALDADAGEVRIDLVLNPLGGVEAVRIADNGTGIDILRAEETFGSLGGSWKRAEDGVTRRYGRRLHGRRGCGRFKAFALGTHVAWRTTMRAGEALLSYVLTGDADNPGLFRLDSAETGPETGTEVYVTGVRATTDSLTVPGPAVQALAAKFALYLKAYPDVRIYFCGIPVSPVVVQKDATSCEVRLDDGRTAKLEIIEWRKRFPGKGRLVFCGQDGFSLHERPAGIRSGQAFSYTAYLQGARFAELASENALVMDDLHPEVRSWTDAARKILKAHFHRRSEEESAARLAKWLAEGSYPYAADDASEERTRFDAAVQDLRAHLDGFDALGVAERKYLFSLLRRLAVSS